jgi:hypothetical protein
MSASVLTDNRPGPGQLLPPPRTNLASVHPPATTIPPGHTFTERIPDPPKAFIGINPFKFRHRLQIYFDEYVAWDMARRRNVMPRYLPSVQRKFVCETVDQAIRSISIAVTRPTYTVVLINFTSSCSAILLLLAAPVVIFLNAEPGVGVWPRAGAATLAVVLNVLWRSAAIYAGNRWTKFHFRQRASKPTHAQITGNPMSGLSFPLIVIFLLMALVPAAAERLPSRLGGTPSWLTRGWLHLTLDAVTWTFGIWVLVSIGFAVVLRINWSLAVRRISRRYPEEHFIDRATSLIAAIATKDRNPSDDPGDAPTPLLCVHVIEDISRSFEQYWPQHLRTGYSHVDLATKTWARQVAGTTRAAQVPLLLRQCRPVDICGPLTQVVVTVISKGAFTEPPKDGRLYRQGVWWRRLGRPAVAIFLLLVMAALVFFAAWQPGLPHVLSSWGLGGIASALNLPSDLRPGVLAGAVAIFGLFVKVIAPDKAGSEQPPI